MDIKSINDKNKEAARYEERAKNILSSIENIEVVNELVDNSSLLPLYIKKPYDHYHNLLAKHLHGNSKALEICSGTGMHTGNLVRMGGNVFATDISFSSLSVLVNNYRSSDNIRAIAADMEFLPFENCSFDVVASAGGLSYGDWDKVLEEIFRVIRPGGVFICVDSLNHNPIYRINRYMHYLLGDRTHTVNNRIPSLSMINKYRSKYANVSLSYFGSVTWLAPLISKITSEKYAANLSDKIDSIVKVKRSAFKFVMLAKKD